MKWEKYSNQSKMFLEFFEILEQLLSRKILRVTSEKKKKNRGREVGAVTLVISGFHFFQEKSS